MFQPCAIIFSVKRNCGKQRGPYMPKGDKVEELEKKRERADGI